MNCRMLRLLFVSICLCCLFFSQAFAQQAPPAGQAPAEKAQLPSPIDKDLSFLLGKWDCKMKIFPNGLIGNTEELKGGASADFVTFGKAIELILAGETSNGKYEAREFYWYDENAKVYNIIAISPEGFAINKKMSKKGHNFVIEYSGIQKVTGKPDVEFTVQAKYKIESDTDVKYYSEVKIGKADYVPFIQIRMKRVPK